MEKLKNLLCPKFEDNELLFRAVLPESEMPFFWKMDRITSAAFKDKKGLSVYRLCDRTKETTLEIMKKDGFRGSVFSVSVKNCKDVEAVVKYLPSASNIYHSEIHGGIEQKILSDKQAFILSRNAKCECASLIIF